MEKVCLMGKPIQRETFVSSVVGKYSSAIRLVKKAKSFARISTDWLLLVIQVKELFEKKKSVGVGQSPLKLLLWQKFTWKLGSSISE